MVIKSNKNKSNDIALTITLISVVTIAFVLTSSFSQSIIGLNTETKINQVWKQSSLLLNLAAINETNSLNPTTSNFYNSSTLLKTDPISVNTIKTTTNKQPDRARVFLFLPNSPYVPLTTVPISLDASKFKTCTYCGYPVQQTDSTQFIFSFPDNTNYGQIAGSDALTLDNFAIQKIDFDSAFIAPKISSLGFDEMAIFASSDTNTYKGTEFGIRKALNDGFIYGYVQEPNENYGDVDFKMLELTFNNGIMHHYTLIVLGSEVSFWIDGINYGYLNFPSDTDYSNLSFSICATIHRFTDNWDSNGDYMIVKNFALNQQ
jgi:hypothetical protein